MAAIGGIDDELILEPAEYEKHRRAAVRRKWVTAAACLLFLSAAVLSVLGAKDHRWAGEDTNSEQSDSDREKAAYHKNPGTVDKPIDAPPIVYVKDTTYKMEQYYPSANLPGKAVFLGRILLHDRSNSSPKENFQSNFEPVGKAVYALGDDILLADDEGYAVYCEIRSNSAPQKEDRSIGPLLSALLALTAVFGITWLLKGKHKNKCRGRL